MKPGDIALASLHRPPDALTMPNRPERTLTLYRDDTTAQVVFERVKTFFWVANNTVLVISRYNGETGSEHHYIHWPRERFCWFKDQPSHAASHTSGNCGT